MVLQIEMIGYPDGSEPDEFTTRLADDLRLRFCGIVDHEIRPNPGLWPFWSDEIEEQVKMLPGNRAIIAVHDLDIAPSADFDAIRCSRSEAQCGTGNCGTGEPGKGRNQRCRSVLHCPVSKACKSVAFWELSVERTVQRPGGCYALNLSALSRFLPCWLCFAVNCTNGRPIEGPSELLHDKCISRNAQGIRTDARSL
jgi:hypothetical protein